MSNILLINSQDYDDDDLIAGNVIVDNEGKTQEIIINVQEAERGPRGVGIPQGGTTGQIMVKSSEDDFNVAWTDLDVPTRTSDLVNDSGFITSSDIPVTSVNGQTGNVTINVPVSTSQLVNDSDFQTSADTASYIAIHNASNTAHPDIRNKVDTIDDLIPNQASTSNQLADKAFVNSSVQTATANFRGNWTDWADVPTVATDYPADYAGNTTPTVNDYLVVQDASDYTLETLEGTWRFKYTGTWATDGKSGWHPEYQVNETPLTAAQLAALNSGITDTLVANIPTGALATVAYSGSYNDLTDRPTPFQIRTKLTANTDLNNRTPGIWPVENIAHPDFPVAGAMYGALIQYPDTYKTQVLLAGEAAGSGNENNMYYRRWLTGSSSWTAWQSAQGSSITVDSALNASSTNPVQNQALYPAIVPTEIYKTVYTYDWTGPAGTNLYNCVAILTMPAGTFTNNSLVELVNEDSFNIYAKHGFVLYGSEVSTQRLWITSIGKPTGTVSLKFRIYKWGN